MLWSFAPWTLLYLVLTGKAFAERTARTETQRFFGMIVGVNLALLCLISAKIDIYLLPLYPFAVYFCSSVLVGRENSRWVRISLIIPALLLGLIFPFSFLGRHWIPSPWAGNLPYLALALLSSGAWLALWQLFRHRVALSIGCLGFGILLCLCTASFSLPHMNHYIGYREMALTAKKMRKPTSCRNSPTINSLSPGIWMFFSDRWKA